MFRTWCSRAIKEKYLQDGLELEALVVRLSAFLGRPLGLLLGVGAIFVVFNGDQRDFVGTQGL